MYGRNLDRGLATIPNRKIEDRIFLILLENDDRLAGRFDMAFQRQTMPKVLVHDDVMACIDLMKATRFAPAPGLCFFWSRIAVARTTGNVYFLLKIYSLDMSTPGGLVGRSETALPAYGIFDSHSRLRASRAA